LLETVSYKRRKHDPSWMARCLGVSEEELDACLYKLGQAQIIAKRRGRYVVISANTVDTQGGQQALHNLKRHWCAVAGERLRAPEPGDLFAYNVMSLTRTDLAIIRERLKGVFREIRSTVAASQPEEVVALMNLQLAVFDPDRPKEIMPLSELAR
jgi:hypothetical protein